MIATGPPQSASCVVANSRNAVTSDLSGRSATSRTVHWSGWDLLTCISSGIGCSGTRPRSSSRMSLMPARVEPVGRLVDDQQWRAAEHRRGYPEALAHALGVGLDLPGSHIGQAGQAKDPGDLAGTAATARGTEHLEVDPPRHPRVEGRLLDHRAGHRHDPRVGKAPAKQTDATRGRRDQAQQHPDGRGLAGAVRAEKTIDLTGRDGQI